MFFFVLYHNGTKEQSGYGKKKRFSVSALLKISLKKLVK